MSALYEKMCRIRHLAIWLKCEHPECPDRKDPECISCNVRDELVELACDITSEPWDGQKVSVVP